MGPDDGLLLSGHFSSKMRLSIQCRLVKDEEDSIYSNYKERKLYIYEKSIGNKEG